MRIKNNYNPLFFNHKINYNLSQKFLYNLYKIFKFIINNKIKIIIFLTFILIIYKFSFYYKKKSKISREIYNLIKKINNYIIICKNGKLLEKIKIFSLNPKVSVVISLFNSAKTIKSSIRSIQNQNMREVEIILVDDFSNDNSLEIIEELRKEDSRIKIIKNFENKGALFSKSIGALNARGEYLFFLDSDDLFINRNILNLCYNEAKKNIDIIEFSGVASNTELLDINKFPKIPYYLRFKKINEIIIQPELSNFIYQKENEQIIKLIDGYIWGKCIKSKILRKVVEYLGDLIYKEKVNYGDDRIINFVLFKFANSFKFIEEFGLIYYENNPFSISNSLTNISRCQDELINIMSIFNITKNTNDINIVIYELNFRWEWIIIPGLNKENKEYANNLLIQIINTKSISENEKIKIKLFLNQINNYSFFN